jgi:hypothetical protein
VDDAPAPFDWGDLATAGYPLTRDAAGAAAAAETVVHYGEIVPRRAGDAADGAPARPPTLPDAPRDGDVTPPEKDA